MLCSELVIVDKKPPINQRWIAIICTVNSSSIVIMDIAVNNRFDFNHGHTFGINFIELLFFQRCEKTFHPGIIIAAAGATHTLVSKSVIKYP